MSWLSVVPKVSDAQQLSQMQLEELITYMVRYGKPRVSYLDGGWYCRVEMNTNTAGTQFDVSSDFGQPTPLQAARMCHERIIAALKTLGV